METVADYSVDFYPGRPLIHGEQIRIFGSIFNQSHHTAAFILFGENPNVGRAEVAYISGARILITVPRDIVSHGSLMVYVEYTNGWRIQFGTCTIRAS
jgi:hypothetical protein